MEACDCVIVTVRVTGCTALLASARTNKSRILYLFAHEQNKPEDSKLD
jgi:hypothetical protein